MNLTPMKVATDAEMKAFEDDCFRDWLNKIDATNGYDFRRSCGDVAVWRAHFEAGMSTSEAVEACRYLNVPRAL